MRKSYENEPVKNRVTLVGVFSYICTTFIARKAARCQRRVMGSTPISATSTSDDFS
jgi:hypothetical protein